MEDECGDDDPEGWQNGANHPDLWMGPASELNGNTLDNCEGNATPDSAVNVTINPSTSLTVDTTVMYTSANKCTIKLYPDSQNATPVSPTPTATATPKPVATVTPTPIATSIPTSAPVITPTPIVPPTATPVVTNSPYVKSGDGTQKSVSTTITWYGYNDNSGETENQHGSADIAYPKSDGYPTIHNQAHEGTGAYTDPITFAAPNKDLKSSFPIGSVIYVPMVRKYFVMEDECGDDDPEGCQNGANHADLWMGPASELNGNTLDDCEGNATPDSAVNVTINPSPSLSVDTTVMYTSANKCTIKLYPDSQNATPVSPTPTATATPKPVATVTPTPIATSIPTSAPVITPTPIVPPTATPVVTNSPYVKSGDGTQKSVSTTITWYGYNDNSGETENQHGSADSAYPKSDGYPTVHNQAHEGTGAYHDPITFAA